MTSSMGRIIPYIMEKMAETINQMSALKSDLKLGGGTTLYTTITANMYIISGIWYN